MTAEGTSCSEKVGVDLDFSRGKGLGMGSSDNEELIYGRTSSSNETYCMVGISSVPILADMILKGFIETDKQEEAFQAMKNIYPRFS